MSCHVHYITIQTHTHTHKLTECLHHVMRFHLIATLKLNWLHKSVSQLKWSRNGSFALSNDIISSYRIHLTVIVVRIHYSRIKDAQNTHTHTHAEEMEERIMRQFYGMKEKNTPKRRIRWKKNWIEEIVRKPMNETFLNISVISVLWYTESDS